MMTDQLRDAANQAVEDVYRGWTPSGYITPQRRAELQREAAARPVPCSMGPRPVAAAELDADIEAGE